MDAARGEEVEGERVFPSFGGAQGETAGRSAGAANAAHQDVHAAETLVHLRHDAFHALCRAHVGFHEQSSRSYRWRAARRRRDRCSGAREMPYDCSANALGAAGDERAFPGELWRGARHEISRLMIWLACSLKA